ncbi:E3 ubiquitin-protein ligase RNF182 isoform X1 [Austrofundulus limnaeus]|uniref:E3 ubiquitin-protein ligase RNF182 n=2 Tax=Austrofundulus limnaeus TaxID=52670 RepID=A0A2I4C0F7_AUSLI|nr:PREDICTED: E3 ubiquitin-protein ligase RNF182-like isoform X1 [Austrofundulus limnaeus]
MHMDDSVAETSGVEEGESHTLGQDHGLKMSSPQTKSEEKDCSTPEELECKICYQRYNAHNRKPKILDCLHRVCTRCLIKILDIADRAGCIPCPFCRHQTEITECQVSALPDDVNIMSHLAMRDKPSSTDQNREVVLTPKSFSSTSSSCDSSNCLVITIMEVPRDSQRSPSRNGSSDIYAEQSLDSVSIGSNGPADPDPLPKFCNHVPRILVWLLGFLYFGSLPLGIYLLVIQRVTLGIVCVSLVPSSLTVCLVYGFCQCLCQGMCDCFARG